MARQNRNSKTRLARQPARQPARGATPATQARPAGYAASAPPSGMIEDDAARAAYAEHAARLNALPSEQSLALRAALMHAPGAGRGPSLEAAERYRVEPANYSARERRQAEYAHDFNGASMNALTFTENTGFPGFPTLALLAQLPEYRTMHETLADECVRMWGRINSTGDTPPDRVADIEAELKRLKIKAAVRTLVMHDQANGRAHAYFKLKDDESFRETPLVQGPYTVRKGSFEGVRVVEAYWVTPNFYNSIDPTAADFYKPSSWWMLGTQTHATRLHTLISRPVMDMLKPAYSFAGVSLSQLAMPYIDNWLRTRQSVSDTVKQFSISGIAMDLQQALLPGGSQDLANRAALINAYRDNRNILFLDKATEEFFQVNTPLSGLDALQAQAQEQMSAVSHTPLVKLLGVTPTGLNASSEGEIRVWYDYVHGYQSNVLGDFMETVLRLIQLSLFGTVDEKLCWEWNKLSELTELEAADARARDADTDTKYIEAGVVRPDQVARRLDADPDSLYSGLLENESLEDLPDDDIEGITEKILEIGTEPMEPAPAAEGAQSAEPAAALPGDPTSPFAPPVPAPTEQTNATPSPRQEAANAAADPGQLANAGSVPPGSGESDREHVGQL